MTPSPPSCRARSTHGGLGSPVPSEQVSEGPECSRVRDRRDPAADAPTPNSGRRGPTGLSPVRRPTVPEGPAPGCLFIEGDAVVAEDMLLRDADFPPYCVRMQHPADYLVSSSPVSEYITHTPGRHRRLIARISWQKSATEFIPMSFVCDTGAPMGFYLSETAREVLRSLGRIREEDRSGLFSLHVQGLGATAVDDTPRGYCPANIMGLRILQRVGLVVEPDCNSFVFVRPPLAW